MAGCMHHHTDSSQCDSIFIAAPQAQNFEVCLGLTLYTGIITLPPLSLFHQNTSFPEYPCGADSVLRSAMSGSEIEVACARVFTVGQPLGSSVLVALSMPATGGKWRPRLLISDREKYLNIAITFSSSSQGHRILFSMSIHNPLPDIALVRREQNEIRLKCMRGAPYAISIGWCARDGRTVTIQGQLADYCGCSSGPE